MAKNNDNKPNGYALSRAWFDFAFENQGIVSGNHGCMFLWFIEKNNRMGWVKQFGAPRDETMAAVGITSYNTYKKIFSDLVTWGFIKVVKESKNQYTAHIIALSNFDRPLIQALDSALIQAEVGHEYQQSSSTDTGTDTDSVAINKQETINLKLINQETIKQDHSLLIENIMEYFDFTEVRNYDKMRDIRTFLGCLDLNNRTQFFSDQFNAYKKLKSKTDPYKHTFKNFLGDHGNLFEDGAWNAENWESKLQIEKSKQNGKANQSTNGRRSHLNPPANSYTKL